MGVLPGGGVVGGGGVIHAKNIFSQNLKWASLYPFLTSGLVHLYHLNGSICSFRELWLKFSLLLYFALKFL